MNRDDKPYIPPEPVCPAPRGGDEFVIRPDQFDMGIGYGPTSRAPRYMHIRGYFYPEGGWEGGQFAATDLVELPADAQVADIAHHANRSDDRAVFVKRVGEILCDRVLNCHGLQGGECWALGRAAVITAIQKAASEM
jgi:hypothetical protein